MKNISNRRRYKLFLKDIQRNEKEGYLKIQTFFAEKGVHINWYMVWEIFNRLNLIQFSRFMKLCKRVGKVAKKRDCYIKAFHVFHLVKNVEMKDAREIPFYKIRMLSKKVMKTYFVSEREDGKESSKGLDSFTFNQDEETLSEVSTFLSLKQMVEENKIH